MPGHVALMTWITCYYHQVGRHNGVQELKTFKHKARVCLTKNPIPTAVSLHFECMVQLVSIRGVLNDPADRLEQVYIVELEAISPVQLWGTNSIITCYCSLITNCYYCTFFETNTVHLIVWHHSQSCLSVHGLHSFELYILRVESYLHDEIIVHYCLLLRIRSHYKQ